MKDRGRGQHYFDPVWGTSATPTKEIKNVAVGENVEHGVGHHAIDANILADYNTAIGANPLVPEPDGWIRYGHQCFK